MTPLARRSSTTAMRAAATTSGRPHVLRDGLCRLIREKTVYLPDCVFEPVDDHYARRELYACPETRLHRGRHDLGTGPGHADPRPLRPVVRRRRLAGPAGDHPVRADRRRAASATASPGSKPCVAGTGIAGSLIPPHEYHTIRNPEPGSQVAISLHIYQKAMGNCAIFEPDRRRLVRGEGRTSCAWTRWNAARIHLRYNRAHVAGVAEW